MVSYLRLYPENIDRVRPTPPQMRVTPPAGKSETVILDISLPVNNRIVGKNQGGGQK